MLGDTHGPLVQQRCVVDDGLFCEAGFVTRDGYTCPVLQIDRGATDKEIRKAYRQLSLQYHPDKNPDPKAAVYFAEKITKAYQALTGVDPASLSSSSILD